MGDNNGSSKRLYFGPQENPIIPCFLPDENCVGGIIDWINQAKKKILVQAFSFSSPIIADALINAKSRDVHVQIFANKRARAKKNSLIEKLESNGIVVQEDKKSGLMHNKVMIIDDEYVITGSYNWCDTKWFYNNEVVLFIRDQCVNSDYSFNFQFNTASSQRGYGRNFKNIYKIDNCCTGRLDMSGYKKTEYDQSYYEIETCFPRHGENSNCIELITNCILEAKHSIFILAASLTHENISSSLENAKEKKINIKILADSKAFTDQGEKLNDLKSKGIDVLSDPTCSNKGGIAHSKTIIIDDDIVITGSFNFSKSAQNKNRENLVKIKNSYVNEIFKKNFVGKWNKIMELSYAQASGNSNVEAAESWDHDLIIAGVAYSVAGLAITLLFEVAHILRDPQRRR